MIVIQFFPAIIANAYNLTLAPVGSELFYLDLDSLILTCYLTIIIALVIYQKEGVASSYLNVGEFLKAIVDDEKNEDNNDGELDKIGGVIKRMNRHSIIVRHFKNN